MTEEQRIEYNTLIVVLEQVNLKIAMTEEAIKTNIEANIQSNSTFYYLVGYKTSLIEISRFINVKLSDYRKTIFKTKNNNYEQTN